MKALEKKPSESHRVSRHGLPGIARSQAMHVQRKRIGQILRNNTIQAKISIGQPNDKYEQEADRVAEQVMSMSEPKTQQQVEPEEKKPEEGSELQRSVSTPDIQRKCPGCEEKMQHQHTDENAEKEPLQTKPITEQITPLLQRQAEPEEEEEIQAKPVDQEVQRQAEEDEDEEEAIQAKSNVAQTSAVDPNLENRIQSMKGRGQVLPLPERNFFEPRLGVGLGNVRVHSDANAAQVARSINAKAFTRGSDVVFGEGQYSPNTNSGRRLIAHELTHVVQQNRSSTRGVLARQASPKLTPAQKALKAIDEFKKRTAGSQAFPGLSRDTIAAELKQRVTSPSLINQSGLPLCGPAAFAYVWASRDILAYINFAVALFEKGKGKLGSLEVSPGSDLKSKSPGSYKWTAGLKPAQVDWMVLSSIRDWENDTIDFEGGPTETTAGGTGEGDIIKWLRELGFSKVKDDVDRTFGDDVDDAKKVDKNVGPGNYILLCVDAQMIDPSMKKKGRANHWVVLVGNLRFSKGHVAFRCYTWGGFRDVNVTEDKFNATYYGAIIATA